MTVPVVQACEPDKDATTVALWTERRKAPGTACPRRRWKSRRHGYGATHEASPHEGCPRGRRGGRRAAEPYGLRLEDRFRPLASVPDFDRRVERSVRALSRAENGCMRLGCDQDGKGC